MRRVAYLFYEESPFSELDWVQSWCFLFCFVLCEYQSELDLLITKYNFMVMGMKYLIKFTVLFYIPIGVGIYLEFRAGPWALFVVQYK